MAADDHAIVVGLQYYPGLDNPKDQEKAPLEGPENDAKAFYDWLVSNDGGGVPSGNITTILSSKYNNTNPAPPLYRTTPLADEIEAYFVDLMEKSDQNDREHKGRRIGRRLYVYLAGHGMVAESVDVNKQTEKEAVLLMQNVRGSYVGTSHFLGAYATTWFGNNGCFDEVFLFADCCRQNSFMMGRNAFLPNNGTVDTGVRCLMFATKLARLSREQMMKDENAVRGVFSKVLLMGLEGGAAAIVPGRNDGMGVITAGSLRGYLIQHMRELLPEELKEDQGNWDPDFDFYPVVDKDHDIVIKEAPLPLYDVIITLRAGATGSLRILFDGVEVMDAIPVPNPLEPIPVQLPRGVFQAVVTINGDAVIHQITVTGNEKGGLHEQI